MTGPRHRLAWTWVERAAASGWRAGLLVGCTLVGCSADAVSSEARDRPVGSSPAQTAARFESVPIELRSARPGGDVEDLRQLDGVLHGVRILGVGEGTHGSSEFFTLRHRFVEWLASDHALRAIALELSVVEAASLDAWVRGGEGDVRELLLATSTWPWHVEEMVSILQWLREHNGPAPPEQQIRLYGIDPQQPWVTLKSLQKTLAVDEELVRLIRDELIVLEGDASAYWTFAPVTRDAAREGVARLRKQFDADATVWKERLGAEFDAVRRAIVSLEQIEAHYRAGENPGVSMPREEAMADNVAWVADQYQSGLVMVWAHNGHISRVPLHRSHPGSMGGLLSKRYEGAYVSVGMLFDRGSFLARDRESEETRTYTFPSGPTNGVGPVLAGVGTPIFALNVGDVTGPRSTLTWPTDPQRFWIGGATVERIADQVGEASLGAAFDVIVFIEEISPAKSLN